MSALMIQAEKRLREIYSIEDSKEDRYRFPIDERAYLFINDYFCPNIKKLNQINSVYFLLKSIRDGRLDCISSDVRFCLLNDIVAFFCGDSIRFYLKLNDTFEDIRIDLYNKLFSITEMLDGSAYEKCYNKTLEELNYSIDPSTTFQEFLSIFPKDIEDIIESNVQHNDFNFIKRREFIDTYTNINENQEDFSEPQISFCLNKVDIKNKLSPFFSINRVNEIFKIISLFIFFKNIENPSLKVNDIVLNISLNNHCDTARFKKEHDLYTIRFPDDIFTAGHSFFHISTAEHFISLHELGSHPLDTKGFENIKENIKEKIVDMFKKRLQISREEISVSYLSLLTMLND